MAKRSRPGLGRSMRWTWEYVSASVGSGSWAFGCASRAPVLLKPIRNGKRRIKKTPRPDARRDRRSLGHGRRPRIRFCCTLPRGRVWDTSVRLRDGKFQFCREADKFHGVTFFAFMKSLRRTRIRTGRRVVFITDNASYHPARLHKEWREEHAQDFGLDYLPPYSPELNPIERVWKLTRRRCLHNRYFSDLDKVIDA